MLTAVTGLNHHLKRFFFCFLQLEEDQAEEDQKEREEDENDLGSDSDLSDLTDVDSSQSQKLVSDKTSAPLMIIQINIFQSTVLHVRQLVIVYYFQTSHLHSAVLW